MTMIEGLYYEFIAAPCGSRVTMPLGLVAGQAPVFFVYRGSSLYRALQERGRVRLLSPYDPLAFLKSVRHQLEVELAWREGCPDVDESLGAWYECNYALREINSEGKSFSCDGLRLIAGKHSPFTRTYGCLVELLVLLTKARAGVWEDWWLPYAEGLVWCVTRSSRGSGPYVVAANEVLQELRALRGGA